MTHQERRAATKLDQRTGEERRLYNFSMINNYMDYCGRERRGNEERRMEFDRRKMH